MLNNCVEALGFKTMPAIEDHITSKELKAVRCSIKTFLPELKGKRLLLHEDNQSVIGLLTHLTSKSSTMMCELRKLFLLIDTYDIKFRTRCIRNASNLWANESPTTRIGSSPCESSSTSSRFGAPTPWTALRPPLKNRCSTKWRNGIAEAMDYLHL